MEMMKHQFFLFVLAILLTATGCEKKATYSETNPNAVLLGTWVRKDDTPGRQPADTLVFAKKGDKYLLTFFCSGAPAPNWPTLAETNYKIENGKLLFQDYSTTSAAYYTADSFEWITEGEQFSIQLYQLLLYMSADYRVTYQKL